MKNMIDKPYIKQSEIQITSFNRDYIREGDAYEIAYKKDGEYGKAFWVLVKCIHKSTMQEVLELIDKDGVTHKVLADEIEAGLVKIIYTRSFDAYNKQGKDLVKTVKDWEFDKDWFKATSFEPYYVWTRQDDEDVPWKRSISFINPVDIGRHILPLSILIPPSVPGDNSYWSTVDIDIDSPDDVVIKRCRDYLSDCPPDNGDEA